MAWSTIRAISYLRHARRFPIIPLILCLPVVSYAHDPLPDDELSALTNREEELSKKISGAPENATLFNSRGRIRFALRNFDGARTDYSRSIDLDPKNALVFHRRCAAAAALGDYAAAVRDCRRALDLDPQNAAARTLLGNIKGALGDYTGQIEDYEKAITLDPAMLEPLVNRIAAHLEHSDLQRAVVACNAALAATKQNGALQAVQKSPLLASPIDLNAPIPLEQFTEKVFTNCAETQRKSGQYELAIKYAEQALTLNPASESAYIQLGDALLALDENQRAKEAYSKGIEGNPDSAGLLYRRGWVESEMEQNEAALQDLELAAKIDDTDAETFWLLGNIYEKLDQKEKSMFAYRRAIMLRPGTADVYTARGIAYYRRGDYIAAEKDFVQAVKLDPENKHAVKWLELLQSPIGRYLRAQQESCQDHDCDVFSGIVSFVSSWLPEDFVN